MICNSFLGEIAPFVSFIEPDWLIARDVEFGASDFQVEREARPQKMSFSKFDDETTA